MRSSRRLLLRAVGAVVAAAALTATVAGPAYADRLDDGDNGSVRTASESGPDSADSDDSDSETDADDREAEREAAERAEETREAAEERAEDERDRVAEARDRTASDRDDAPGRMHRDRAAKAQGPDRSHGERPGNRASDGTGDRAMAPADRASAAPPAKKRKHKGVYGLDKDPGALAKDNLDGRTDQPGVYYPGLGTVEAPGIDSR